MASAPTNTLDHDRCVRELLKQTRANDGRAPVDLDRFWSDQEVACADPFGAAIPQVPLGIGMSWECIPTELGVEMDAWTYLHDKEMQRDLNRRYNDRAERIVGRRLLPEPDPAGGGDAPSWPPHKQLHDLFEAEHEWRAGSWWLHPSAHGEDELKALLDRVDERLDDLRAWMLPPEWDERKAACRAAGLRPPLYRGQRGPVTFATSICGTEEFLFLVMDNPDLAKRLSDAILRGMLGIGRVLDEEAGHTPETLPRGFGFCDDNCCLMTPEMYELFACPILEGVFARYSPDPGDKRFQHSDSDMEHLLPLLGRVGLNEVNFGPTLRVASIRRHLPDAVIRGQLAPFTFSRNEEENIVREFLRDFEDARAERGLVFATAGSINDGSRLTGMRLIMAAIQRYGRYDG